LPVNPNHEKGINVQDQENDPGSLLNFYRQLLQVRRNTPALVEGDFLPVHETDQDVLAFLRSTTGQKVLILLNFSEKRLSLDFSDLDSESARVVFSTANQVTTHFPNLYLNPFEIWIAELV
jgi:glycosidase